LIAIDKIIPMVVIRIASKCNHCKYNHNVMMMNINMKLNMIIIMIITHY